MAEEEWRPVAGYPDYEVSNFGLVRDLRTRWGARKQPRILKASPAANGYPRVTLCNRGEGQRYRNVHVLVCEAFHGSAPSANHEVAHYDGDRTNARADNLRWATNADNHMDRKRHLRAMRKLTPADIPIIRQRIAAGERHSEIASDYGVTASSIQRIGTGKTWAWLGDGTPIPKVRKDKCHRGHVYDRVEHHGSRRCSECSRIAGREYLRRRRKKQAAAAIAAQ